MGARWTAVAACALALACAAPAAPADAPIARAPTPGGEAFDRIARLARSAPRGAYPRAFLGEQPYWTILGDDPGDDEALADEDGRVEPWKGGPSIEPFLVVAGDSVLTWANGETHAGLASQELPSVAVLRTRNGASIAVQAFAYGADSAACLHVRYEVTAETRPLRGELVLALRPFQVVPPVPSTDGIGGVSVVRRIARHGDRIAIDAHPPIRLGAAPDAFTACASEQLDPADPLRAVGDTSAIDDPAGAATALVRYAIDLPRGRSRTVDLEIPLASAAAPSVPYEEALRRALAAWKTHGRLSQHVQLPGADVEVVQALDAQLLWARVTRDGPALKPGARANDRAWIRDGVLSADAFLRSGQPEVAKDFADWYARFVAADGAVPRCIDARGPDPTPAHDSEGEFVFLVAEIVRYTGDVALAERLWPAVRRAALHIDALRGQGRAAHSARPAHLYTDDLWELRGLRDAADLARRLGHAAEERRFAASRDTLAADLARSVRAGMAAHAMGDGPDLGELDAASAAVALDPVAARDVLPRGALERTFERYWRFFLARRDSGAAWDAYSPHELRIVGAMARLGWRERSTQALAWFMKALSPAGFLAWPEVVGRDPRHGPFAGDMPHTGVGTDAVRAGLDLVAFVSGADSALVLGAGIPAAWLRQPVTVRELPTPFGPVSYTMTMSAGSLEVRVGPGVRVPRGGVRVWPPAPEGGSWRRATIDGAAARLAPDGSVVVRTAPAVVRFTR